MSGKRLLDFIALGQAATSIIKKSLPTRPGNLPLRYEHVARKLSASQEASSLQKDTLDSVNLLNVQKNDILAGEGHIPGQPDKSGFPSFDTRIDDKRPVIESKGNRRYLTSDPAISNPVESIPLPLRSWELTDATTSGRPIPSTVPGAQDEPESQVQEEISRSQASATEEQVPGSPYSQLFRSRRGTALLRKPPQKQSAWANLRFQPTDSAGHWATGLKEAPSIATRKSIEPDDNSRSPSAGASNEVADTRSSQVESLPQEKNNFKVVSPLLQGTSYQLHESKVPSSRFGRLWQYGGLATSLVVGAAGEGFRRSFGATNEGNGRSIFLSDSNLQTLVSKLSRMRGAALKLGQMMSFQDLKILPGPLQDVLQRVQDSADYMPAWQRDKVLSSNLGSDWKELFSDFEDMPLAAASIGQVHAANLKSTGMPVAIKIQYPGVADSISSDLSNLSMLLTASRLLPKGLYLDKTIANARTELSWECDYIREAEAARRFGKLLKDEYDTFRVPKVVDAASGSQVLTMERMFGTAVTKVATLEQDERDWIATNLLRLCLRELFEFRYMQTDPNWTNFLYNADTRKLELLDFGASRDFASDFIDTYVGILKSAARGHRASIADLSVQLGYLTGHEGRVMRDAHIDSVLTLAEPFADSAPEIYDFSYQTITDRVRALIPVMLRERLSPPPEETYSLHRKLSGAFLLCARLGGRVPARSLFQSAVEKWQSKPHSFRGDHVGLD